MDRDGGPAASPYGDGVGAGGAGGKFRKRPYRRPTPYDRPPLPTTAAGAPQRKEGWLSKIATGASRFLPSLFSRTPPPLLPSQSGTTEEASHQLPNHDSYRTGATKEASHQLPNRDSYRKGTTEEASHQLPNYDSDSQASESSEQRGTSEAVKLTTQSDTHELVTGDKSVDSIGLASIEQLMKQKTFSRDEFLRLMEVLRSRTSEPSNEDGGGDDIQANVTVAVTPDKDLQKSNEKRWAGGNQITGNMPDTAVQSKVFDEVGNSPVEIAKAFMESRTSASSLKSHSPLTDRKILALRNDFTSTALKSPTCWPGAVIQDEHHFLTPQTERSRTVSRHFPRSPYHGSIPSRSVSRLHDGIRPINLSSTRRRQPYPTFLSSAQKKTPVLENGFPTVGPIHSMRQKSSNIWKGETSSHPSSSGALQPSTSNTLAGFPFSANEKLELGASTSNMENFQNINKTTPRHAVSNSVVHPQSTAIARKILEHLDRTLPSPKDKAAELKLAVARNKQPPGMSADFSNGEGGKSNAVPQSQSASFHVSTTSQENGGKGKELLYKQVGDKMVDGTVSSGSVSVQATEVFSCMQEVSEQSQNRNNNKNQLWPPHSTAGNQGTPVFGNTAGHGPLQLQKHQPHPFGNKSSLTSISIGKPNGKHTILDNGPGFTFPVSRTFSVPSEPPTPSIFPSFGGKSLQPEGTAVPSFKFGSSGTARGSVFSFGSPSGAASVNASSIPEFKFGSDQKRVSFSVAGKDAICY